jgi:hypothetical protein
MVEHFSAGIERLETGEEENQKKNNKRNRSGIDPACCILLVLSSANRDCKLFLDILVSDFCC